MTRIAGWGAVLGLLCFSFVLAASPARADPFLVSSSSSSLQSPSTAIQASSFLAASIEQDANVSLPTYVRDVPQSFLRACPTRCGQTCRARGRCARSRWGRHRFRLEVEAGPVWQSRNEAAFPGDTGTRFDVDDVTGTGPFAYGRVTLDMQLSRRHALRAIVAPLQIKETGTLGSDVSFGGTTFTAGPSTEATYKFNSYRIGYRYLFARGRTWTLHVGATAKIRDANIELRQGAVSSRKTDLGFVPLLHIDLEWSPQPGWTVTADLDGLAAPQGRAFDFAIKLHRDLSPRARVGIGYRMIEGGAENDTVYTFSWFHQAVVSFTYKF